MSLTGAFTYLQVITFNDIFSPGHDGMLESLSLVGWLRSVMD